MMRMARCTSDEQLAAVSSFMLEHKRSLHASYSTMDMVMTLYSYITDGHLIQVTDADGRVIGAAAYFIGTPEREYADQEVAFIDVAIAHPAYRGTRLFLAGLNYTVQSIREHHPQVSEIRLAALSDNVYVCKLYAKFATFYHNRDGSIGQETVFRAKIDEISTFLAKFYQV